MKLLVVLNTVLSWFIHDSISQLPWVSPGPGWRALAFTWCSVFISYHNRSSDQENQQDDTILGPPLSPKERTVFHLQSCMPSLLGLPAFLPFSFPSFPCKFAGFCFQPADTIFQWARTSSLWGLQQSQVCMLSLITVQTGLSHLIYKLVGSSKVCKVCSQQRAASFPFLWLPEGQSHAKAFVPLSLQSWHVPGLYTSATQTVRYHLLHGPRKSLSSLLAKHVDPGSGNNLSVYKCAF